MSDEFSFLTSFLRNYGTAGSADARHPTSDARLPD